MTEATPLMHATNLTKLYPDGQVTALDGVDFSLQHGEYVAITGPSGSGKSTLLSLMGALDVPTSGEIYFEGEQLDVHSNLDELRAKKIGFVFQSFYLLPTLTAVENIQVPMFGQDYSSSERIAKAEELIKSVGLADRAEHLPKQLSVGQRQRVAIARSLANDPVLLLADEPTGNLDSKSEQEILNLFSKLHKDREMTLLVVTHSDEVARNADRRIHVRDGKIVSDAE